jgi:hypothetical protein
MTDSRERRTDAWHGRTDLPRRQTPPPNAPEDPAACERCGARFVDDRLLALHRGRVHTDELRGGEREAYRDAVEAEQEDIRLFRLKAIAALVAVYFGFILVYAFVV